MQKALFCCNFNSFLSPVTRLMACATFFKRFMELKIKLIRRVARLVFQPITVTLFVLLISPDCNAWKFFFVLLLAWSRVFGFLSLVKGYMLARITLLFLCENIHCTLTLPLSTGSLVRAWSGHFFYLHAAKCCGVTGYDGLVSINSGQEQVEGGKQYYITL